MNNIKNKRTGLKLLGSVRGANYKRFTYNKTQQNQPVYKNIEPRCPGKQGNKGCRDCSGSSTLVGCKTCMGCVYSFDVSGMIFNGAYPTYGSFANINPIRDSSGAPCEWQYNAIVEGFSFNGPSLLYDTTVTLSIESNRCVNVQDICGVYFYEPVGGNLGVYAGNYSTCSQQAISDLSHNIIDITENKFVTNAKRMGAPYRNPIAGWRKTLNCCERPCEVILYETGNHNAPTSGTLIGYQYSSTERNCNGTVTDYTTDTGNPNTGNVTSITLQLDNCCCIPAIDEHGTITRPAGPYEVGPITNVVVVARETSGAAKQPTNNVYKDTYSGGRGAGLDGCGACAVDCNNSVAPRSGIQGRTHQPIIRSGMQEKKPCCRDSNGRCDKTNDYSFSYWQYQHNKRCLDYQRSQEKYVGSYPACVTGRDGKQQCQNAYRKASCCDCDCICDQIIDNNTTGLSYIPQVGDKATQAFSGASGIVTSTSFTPPDLDGFTIKNDDCNILFIPGQDIIITGPAGQTETIYSFTITATNPSTNPIGCNKKSLSKTIYKPSNKKFSHQGAVTSGGRLERLKLDTIRTANSKCIKGRRCREIPTQFQDITKIYTYPNGTYGGGKPRFTGWMFNGHHREVKGRVYNMVRYNQQPLGIPQLTINPPGKTCIKKCFPRTLNLGTNRSTAAGNRARIPGIKCPHNAIPCNKCGGAQNSPIPCGNIPYQSGQGLPCCN